MGLYPDTFCSLDSARSSRRSRTVTAGGDASSELTGFHLPRGAVRDVVGIEEGVVSGC
jgi:hypothetical protein